MSSWKKLATGLAIVLTGAITSPAFALTQLGFAIDESGSIGAANYEIEKQGLAAALAALPTDGSIELTVISFSDNVQTLVAPTVLTAANLAAIQMAITSDAYSMGTTNTAAAINSLTAQMTGSANFVAGDPTLINISTDGQPFGGPNPQAAAEAAAVAAAAAGVNSISFEVIGGSPATVAASAQIAFPGPVNILPTDSTDILYPSAANGSFVVPVSSIAAYAPVILAKVQSVAQVPVSGSLSLLALGFAALGAARIRKSRATA